MSVEEMRDRLDRRDYATPEVQDFVRSALIGLIDGAVNEGHTALVVDDILTRLT